MACSPAAGPAAGDVRCTPSPAACPWAALAPSCLAALAGAGPAGALFGAGPCLASSSAACSGLREAPSAEALCSGPRGPNEALLGSGSGLAGDARCIRGGSTSEMSDRNRVWCACRSSSLCAAHHHTIMQPCAGHQWELVQCTNPENHCVHNAAPACTPTPAPSARRIMTQSCNRALSWLGPHAMHRL